VFAQSNLGLNEYKESLFLRIQKQEAGFFMFVYF
jgi:hypothetical protein